MWAFLEKVFSSPAQVATLIITIIIMLLLLKLTGFSYSKEKGIQFNSVKTGDAKLKNDDLAKNVIANSEFIAKIIKRLDLLELSVMQVLFYSNAHPIVRITAGLSYLRDGGNGPVKADVRVFIAKYPAEYRAVCFKDNSLANIIEEYIEKEKVEEV